MLYQLSYGHILQNTKELNLTSDNINTFGVLTLTYTKYLFSQPRNNIFLNCCVPIIFKYLTLPRIWTLRKIIKTAVLSSGNQDSNLGPLHPKCSILTGLNYYPNLLKYRTVTLIFYLVLNVITLVILELQYGDFLL